MSRAAAVVVAHDRAGTAARTVDAIRGQEAAPEVLILVANGATPDVARTLEAAAADHPAAEVVRLVENGGAAGGFNAGLARALARDDVDLAICFDDDATPLPGCVAALRAAAERLPAVGTAGAVAHDGSGRLSWGMHADAAPAPLHTLDEVRALAAEHGGALDVAGMCFHGLTIPLEVLRRHGNVDARLFHQYEDAELGLRMRRAGLHNWLVAAAEVEHPLAPASRKVHVLGRELAITRQSPAKEYLTLRNDLVVRRRYNGARFWYATGPLILVRGLLVALSLDLPRRVALREVFARAVGDALRGRLGPPPAPLARL